MRISVVVTAYRQARELELALAGYARQGDPDFEVVVADDGSGEETADVVERSARESGLRVTHVWHSDRGFRKTEILNRALREVRGEYLVFSDADCIPREDFVGTHRAVCRRGRFLSGGYVRLSPAVSSQLRAEDVREGRPFRADWLRGRGQTLGKARLRLLTAGVLPGFLDLVTPTRATFNGMNSSVWTRAALAVDGFDMDYTYGGLDREFGARLQNLGLRGVQVRHRAVVVHLHHERPYRDQKAVALQRRRRSEVERGSRTRAVRGLSTLDEAVETRVRRFGTEVVA